ncbi:hypothetical protein CIP106467_4093 [Citrobacter europaeus]|nr:hypothetical protein CIP106467_4093 [Citrobacter europaeus]
MFIVLSSADPFIGGHISAYSFTYFWHVLTTSGWGKKYAATEKWEKIIE